jgi:hypothetical protein
MNGRHLAKKSDKLLEKALDEIKKAEQTYNDYPNEKTLARLQRVLTKHGNLLQQLATQLEDSIRKELT